MSIKSINSQLPKVTICVPVRNGARTIQRTLDSLLNQDYPNYEIIVSDNCSDDDTANIVSQYVSNGVKYFINPVLEKWGESNWNHILSLAKGPFIALYHADDICTSTMVRRQVEFLLKYPEASAVFTMSQTIDEQDRPIRMGCFRLPKELRSRDRFEFPEFFNATLKYCTFVPVPTMMTRRPVLDAVGVFRWQMFASASDIDLYLRMARQWGPIGVIDVPLHKYRISSGQGSALITRNRTELADYFRTIDAHLNDSEDKRAVQPQSIAFYEMYRSADQVKCAMNLLIQKKTVEACANLWEALHWRHFVIALRRPRMLSWLLVGVVLLVSTSMGFGTSVARWVQREYARRNAWLRWSPKTGQGV